VSQSKTTGDAPGITARVDAWLDANTGLAAPCSFELIAGGRSNLTYRVTDREGTTAVLRRPPLGELLPSAHDMGREHRIIAALHGSAVPVAEPLGFCEDESVAGAPFYVMAHVPGTVIRNEQIALTALDEAGRARVSDSLVEVLAELHRVDPDAVGLGDLGKREDYVARQLGRWSRQWEASRTRELPLVDDVHRRLVERIPVQQTSSIAHGDYRLDNLMIGPDATVAAVFDWELGTLGDPLADLAALLTYWGRPDDEFLALPGTPTVVEGFPDRPELAARYGATSDLDLEPLPYYVAFAHWRLACILEGVYARFRSGAMGQEDEDLEGYADRVGALAARADDILRGGAW
jgi:aminoglycoside phosphotransferase (APT) family kinase protein